MYSAPERELFCIVYGVLAAKNLIQECHITIFSGCKSLLYCRLGRRNSGVLTKYSILLSAFDITIKHIIGEQNVLADTLTNVNIGPSNPTDKNIVYMSENEVSQFPESIPLPEDVTIESTPVKKLLELDGFPSLLDHIQKTKKKRKITSTQN